MEITMTMLHTYPTPVTSKHEERHHTMTTSHINCSRKLASSNESHGLIEWTTYHIAAICVIALLFIVTLFGSTLVIISIMKFKRLQIPSNYILLNMAIADICVATMMPLILVIELVGDFSRNIYVCMLPYCLITLASGVSLISLCIIAYDRFAALVKPLRYGERITTVKIALICAGAWIYVLLISSVPFLGWYYSTEDLVDFKCQYRVFNNYAILFQIASIFLPGCIVMIFCYCRVMLVARRHTRAISAVQVSLFPSQANINKSYSMFKGNKYTRTLALILGIFMITWVVFIASLLIEIFCPICGCTVELHKYTGLLVFLNSALNSWVYCYRNKDFKAAFRRLLRPIFPCLRKNLSRSQSQLNDGRRGSTSRVSEALSRTNSMVGGINQQLQVLYENEVMGEVEQPLPQKPKQQIMHQASNNNSSNTLNEQGPVTLIEHPQSQKATHQPIYHPSNNNSSNKATGHGPVTETGQPLPQMPLQQQPIPEPSNNDSSNTAKEHGPITETGQPLPQMPMQQQPIPEPSNNDSSNTTKEHGPVTETEQPLPQMPMQQQPIPEPSNNDSSNTTKEHGPVTETEQSLPQMPMQQQPIPEPSHNITKEAEQRPVADIVPTNQ